ncbi:hypothetical protein ACFW2T_28820 [Streptomyces sp. NPDC058892]|uniref:hypothetical protein n=1 Tax=unclassified Streptomyces TaxID=2593676 RepID=UPI0036C3747D
MRTPLPPGVRGEETAVEDFDSGRSSPLSRREAAGRQSAPARPPRHGGSAVEPELGPGTARPRVPGGIEPGTGTAAEPERPTTPAGAVS